MDTPLPLYPATTRAALDRVLRDLKLLAADAEVLLDSTKEDANAAVIEARERVAIAIQQARSTYADLEERAVASVRAAAEETDATIRAHPYESLGIALGAGVLLGMFIRGR